MTRVSLLALFAIVSALAATMPAAAQDNAWLSELYGDGVHAYFAGDNQAAYESLTEAIEGGTDDPRAYIFRGLVLERMGRPEAAVADFQAGAIAEVRDTDHFYNVNASLQRVQGYTRLAIEDYRQAARVNYAEQVRAEQQQRYQRRQGNEAAVLRGEPIAPTRDFESIEPGATLEGDDDDLFGDGSGSADTGTDTLPARGPAGDLFEGETGSGAAGDTMEDELFPGMDDAEEPFGDEGEEPSPFEFGDDDEGDAMPLNAGDEAVDELPTDADDSDDLFGGGGSDDDIFDEGDEEVMEPARPREGAAGESEEEDEGPGGSFGLGDIFGGGGGRPSGDFEAGPPGMDDGELPYEDGSEELDAADDQHQAGPPGMDDEEFPYADEGDEAVDPFGDDVPRPEMGEEFLEQGDPSRPSDGRPTMGEEFEREEGGVLEESGVPAADAVEDGPGAEDDFDELFGT